MTRKAAGVALGLLVLAWCVITAPHVYGSSSGFWAHIGVIVIGLWVFSVPALTYIAVWFLAVPGRARSYRTVSLALGLGAFSGAWITIAGLLAFDVFQQVSRGYVSMTQAVMWLTAPVAAAPIAMFGAAVGFFIGLIVARNEREV
jgi:hypothetical protein